MKVKDYLDTVAGLCEQLEADGHPGEAEQLWCDALALVADTSRGGCS